MDPHSLPHDGVRQPDGVIALTLTTTLVLGRDRTAPLPVCFRYDRQQPFAVLLELPEPGGLGSARWVFSRDLLQSGLHRPSGEGDVRVWPPCCCNDRPDVRMMLRDGSASALLDVPVQPLREWLVSTWEAVPPGDENALIDWDSVTEALLGEG
ncbi:sporulation-specific cell division protein SsgB [Streptomyces viridiviolaceus]|uniref:SsgA family sporulation/cell division regulator n=1 Tax=Streptomyces viridiviolaceus TaxID=68282 RepID=A0ABW2E7P2_9ACTN|nr:SsgA family sporulation/cell division regulator [Streptomyces viridiviolaceus]GHB68311.1 sporulation-specific cell division protein SsgB [Streptomyces viridiviolaceus]